MRGCRSTRGSCRLFIGLGLAAVACTAPAATAAITCNFTYDSSIPSGELANVQSSMNYVASELNADFSNNAALNITIKFSSSVSGGQSSANYEDDAYTYGQLRTALLAQTPSDAANLPVSNPTTYTTFTTTSANAKALGLPLAGNASDSDGTITFGDGPWTFFPNQPRQASGLFDFTGTAEHEITELMGRQSLLAPLSNNQIGPFDLFRYSANGVRSLDPTTSADGSAVHAYFSIDNGATNLMAFNDVTGGDIHDWAGDNHDSFDASGPPDDAEPITPVDLQAMNAIGWSAAVPEPTALDLLVAGAGAVVIAGRRRSRSLSRT
jgi:hypothetical protein